MNPHALLYERSALPIELLRKMRNMIKVKNL